MNPELYDYVMDRLFAAGALDVYFIPIQMKKNRPAVQLNVLTEDEKIDQIIEIILKESTTIGLRIFENIKRHCLDRKKDTVETDWGKVGIKVALKENQEMNFAPEYDDCKIIAEKSGLPLKKIYNLVIEKWLEKNR